MKKDLLPNQVHLLNVQQAGLRSCDVQFIHQAAKQGDGRTILSLPLKSEGVGVFMG